VFAILVTGKPWVASQDFEELKDLAREMQPCLSASVSITRWRSNMCVKHPSLDVARRSFENWAYTDGENLA